MKTRINQKRFFLFFLLVITLVLTRSTNTVRHDNCVAFSFIMQQG